VKRRHFLRLVASVGLIPSLSRVACATSYDTTLAAVRIIEVAVLIVPDADLKPLVPYDAIKPQVINHLITRLRDAGFETSVVDFSYFVEPRDVLPQSMIITSIRIDLQRALIGDRQVVLGAVSIDFIRRGSETTAGVPMVSPDGRPMSLFVASDKVLADDCLEATLKHVDNAIIAPYIVLNNPNPL
jgi:hypothetical protein